MIRGRKRVRENSQSAAPTAEKERLLRIRTRKVPSLLGFEPE